MQGETNKLFFDDPYDELQIEFILVESFLKQ